MQSFDVVFGRVLMAKILPDVRKAIPDVKLRDAWVYKFHKDQWEFHYRDFYWHGSAGNAYEARYNGWAALLNKLEAPGWTLEEVR